MAMNDKSTEKLESPPVVDDTKSTKLEDAHTLPPTGKMAEPISEDVPNIPGYRIDGVLGRGGMGIVYLATDISLQRQVAIKIGLTHAQAANKARFQSEAAALARLQHPHIVQIYGTGTTSNGLSYFVMEYVAQGSLADLIDKKPQPPRDAARLIQLLAKAVHLAHQRGIIHRDLKPGNILLAPQADEPALNCDWGCPKIADFGLVKLLDTTTPEQQATTTGQVLGTPSYMAPEQARSGKTIGPATDVYALGAILYTLLAGRPPFQGGTSIDVILQMIEEAPPSLKELRPELPDGLIAICEKCLAKKAQDRFASAGELAKVLDQFISSSSVELNNNNQLTQATNEKLQTAISSKVGNQRYQDLDMVRQLVGLVFPIVTESGDFPSWTTTFRFGVRLIIVMLISCALWIYGRYSPHLIFLFFLSYMLQCCIAALFISMKVSKGSKAIARLIVVILLAVVFYAVVESTVKRS